MKYYICEETSSIYWMDDGHLAFIPMMLDGTFDTEEGGLVEEDLVGDEFVGNSLDRTLSDVYKEVREKLKGEA